MLARGINIWVVTIIGNHPDVNKLILWFDSCVPQNRNSHMSIALCEFLIRYPKIRVIEQKFCESGHSSIQEVDNMHSKIDRALALLKYLVHLVKSEQLLIFEEEIFFLSTK